MLIFELFYLILSLTLIFYYSYLMLIVIFLYFDRLNNRKIIHMDHYLLLRNFDIFSSRSLDLMYPSLLCLSLSSVLSIYHLILLNTMDYLNLKALDIGMALLLSYKN